MYKIAVIGGPDSVAGFRALGLDAYPVQDAQEARRTLREIARPTDDPYVIIYLEETLAEPILDEVRKYDAQPTPAIILIPGRDGPVGLGQEALRQAVEKAVGTNIL
ncbi:MAG: V-type ATP synthase subunit F [Oscillospiraceae bacterium]|jgi:V/A-type H+-transporting ATPase subunit F|nr:V-type ATP synthase subunit F [Oscillospiraceae bacterium]MBQ2633982.1 V-type ATP synthase subunit F [Oscillospiraceae bacterium]MBR3083823.1 V-type ATP synthase subunit F [Oscillospiraceae bacterium]MBR3860633.1 V-type ATP synthase subunit F [Oscillospiraceae bacterium]MBR6096480.1 V-type ATP synthase subunit F [Oscillospiraceae bacterium]